MRKSVKSKSFANSSQEAVALMEKKLVIIAVVTVVAQLVCAQSATPPGRLPGTAAPGSSQTNAPGVRRLPVRPRMSEKEIVARTEQMRLERERLEKEDRAREAAENVVVIRSREFSPSMAWNRAKGKGLVFIVVGDFRTPGYEMKFDAEGRLEYIAAYTNQVTRYPMPPAGGHSVASTNVPPVAPVEEKKSEEKAGAVKAEKPTAPAEKQSPKTVQAETAKDAGDAAATNDYFKAWGIPIGASMLKVQNGGNTFWQIPGSHAKTRFRLAAIESFSMPPTPSVPIVNLTCRRFTTQERLFDSSWFVYAYVSVDHRIVAVSTMSYSEGVSGSLDEIRKSPLVAKCQKLLDTLKERYGDAPEVMSVNSDRNMQYTWHKGSVDVILTTGNPWAFKGSMSMNGVITLYYIDKDLVAKANEAYKNMPPEQDEGEEEKAKDLL